MRLYHGTAKQIEGATLNPSPYLQTKNGRESHWLFATHRLDQAELFSTPWMGFPDDPRHEDNSSGAFLATATQDPQSPLIVFITTERERYLRSIQGTIYSFPADGFELVKNHGREWVREQGVDLFNDRTGSHVINSIEPMLEKGVQIFFAPPAIAKKFVKEILDPVTQWPEHDVRPELGILYRAHQNNIVWENRERSIRPDPVITEFTKAAPIPGRGHIPAI